MALGKMNTDILAKLDSIDWRSHTHPCLQDQGRIPRCFKLLISDDVSESYEAALNLWDISAHQGCVGSSSVDLTPLLCEVYHGLSELVQVEVLDTLYQFANCVADDDEWTTTLKEVFEEYRPLFEKEQNSDNEYVAGFSQMILEALSK